MNNETSTRRRRFLKQASLLVAGVQAGVLLPSASAAVSPGTAGPARSSSAAQSEFVVDTLSGKVRGTVQDGIKVFKGIPYGASTAGKNRFMPPKKPVPWSGVRESTAFGHAAPQVPLGSIYDYARIIDWLTLPGGQAEDCLVLNVWTPALKDTAKRPVLVSFHGGGFTSGTGANILYNGHPLAKFGDVVVVTLNHRLGCLGYLNLADIGAPPEFAQAGVAGMMDCVLALEWVRDHIANFGGDPSKVMIFGQSGGGSKVTHLLAMPSARGLFHRAAIQSAGSPLRAVTRECATRAAERMLAQIGLTRKRATELQQVPVEMMLSAQASLDAQDVPAGFAPVLDGSVIPRHPFDPDAPAISADVPVIVSTTLDDVSFTRTDFDLDQAGLSNEVMKIAPGRADGIVAAYRRAFPTSSPFLLLCKMLTDRGIRRNAYLLADRKAALLRAPAYMYLLEFPSPAYGGKFGAVHATDVPLVFHNIEGQQMTGNSPESRRVADQMAAAWVAFAKTGNPNHAGIPSWPTYTPDKQQTMIFNQTSHVENAPRSELRAMWSEGESDC
jgi:para-nitrobenzyl esterase